MHVDDLAQPACLSPPDSETCDTKLAPDGYICHDLLVG